MGTTLGVIVALWLGWCEARPTLFRWHRLRRSWPKPCPRPEGYSVEGESWPGCVPPEPMTHRQAEFYRRRRSDTLVDVETRAVDADRFGLTQAVRDTEARERMATMAPYLTQDARNDLGRRAWEAGLATTRPKALTTLRGMAQQAMVTPEEYRRQRQAQQGGECHINPMTLRCLTHDCSAAACTLLGR